MKKILLFTIFVGFFINNVTALDLSGDNMTGNVFLTGTISTGSTGNSLTGEAFTGNNLSGQALSGNDYVKDSKATEVSSVEEDFSIVNANFEVMYTIWSFSYEQKKLLSILQKLSESLQGISYNSIAVYLDELVNEKIDMLKDEILLAKEDEKKEIPVVKKEDSKKQDSFIVSKNLDESKTIKKEQSIVTGQDLKSSVTINYISPNGKVYKIFMENGKYTFETSSRKKYFSTKEEIMEYINLNNKPIITTTSSTGSVSMTGTTFGSISNTPVKGTDPNNIVYKTPNGNTYTIQKISNGFVFKGKTGLKLFATLDDAKKYLNENNK